MVLIGGIYNLVGLTSFGTVDCSAPFPAVFTRITAILDWIEAALTEEPR